MSIHSRVSTAVLTAIGFGAPLGASTANASDEVADEIVVYGTPVELVLDAASLRVDVKQHARAIGRSVREALALAEKVPDRRVAAAPARSRG
jgi:hypothetical protein